MGKNRSLIMIAVAVVIALVFSMVAYSWLKAKGANADKAKAIETQPIVVALTDLMWGTVLTREVLGTKEVIKNAFPGAFTDPSTLVGRVLISNVKAGEPIFESRLAAQTIKMGGVSAVVSPQKRAIAIKVDKSVAVAGFIRPGSRVDVLVTLPGRSDKVLSEPITKTILENMLVLTVGSEIDPKTKEPTNVDVITIECTPEEAEKVALASAEGRIQIALRNQGDADVAMTRGARIENLLTSYSQGSAVPSKPAAVVAKAKPVRKSEPVAAKKEDAPVLQPKLEARAPYVVELIKGGKVTEIKF